VIIGTEFGGRRFVAVGSTMHWGKWKTFFDFLSDYIKQVLGGEWGNAELPDRGIHVGRKRVARLMRGAGLLR